MRNKSKQRDIFFSIFLYIYYRYYYSVPRHAKKIQKELPAWQIDAYQLTRINTFPAEPNGTILEFEHLLRKDSAILEAGCGEGQNIRYLAKNGYSDIYAFDLSEAGISKLHWICEREGLQINAFTDDLAKFQFAKSYDLVMTFATLCFVEKDKWKRFIEDAKEHTKPNGIHIIHTFTNTVPASPDIALFAVGLADEGEIKDLYSDWEVLQFKSYVFDDEHPGCSCNSSHMYLMMSIPVFQSISMLSINW